ncbi:hypothetical protein [Azovibrio restrictus]|uniref:hypothetical protein n=1 Tax=Azovibrio restrictus TaxID=146938 RepID=UPI0026EDCFBB|nr:hypothetical protein [Azovibrio restrictus]
MFLSHCSDCRTPLCERLCGWLKKNKKTVRWAVFLFLMCAFFFWLGTVAQPVNGAGFCKIYY